MIQNFKNDPTEEFYIFRDDLATPNDVVPLELTGQTPFQGVVYKYYAVNIDKDTDNDQYKIKFQYNILDPAKFKEADLRKDSKFIELLSVILNSLILQWSAAADDREDYTEEPHSK